MRIYLLLLCAICMSCFAIPGCQERTSETDQALIKSFNLKRGELVSCGPPDGKFGSVTFGASVPDELKTDFNTAVALLHSFEYDEAEKIFARIIDKEPACAMAYWGVAMSNFHPLWAPPTPEELKKGAIAIKLARNASLQTRREKDYIEAIAVFFEDTAALGFSQRVKRFAEKMETLYSKYPEDNEAAIFYSLALNAAADPADKGFTSQRKAISLLTKRFEKYPMHPGIAHYIIHNSDYPELAAFALPAARKYASIAPASAHAQHMPSHIFTRLGLWDESIQSNLASVSSARCYAEQAGIKGHWDEELHGLDYLLYAYLQKGDDKSARAQLDYLLDMKEVHPVNFKVAYSFAAAPSRFHLETRAWKEAAALQPHTSVVDWEKYPWQKAIVHFTKLLGAVNTNDIRGAKTQLAELKRLHSILATMKNVYKEKEQVEVQVKTGEAWILLREGKHQEALSLMKAAADLEDGLTKHPVTPGEILPARELLGDMLLSLNKAAEALEAYEADIARHANRFHGLYGAALAAERAGKLEKAGKYFRQLLNVAGKADAERTELRKAKQFLSSTGKT